MFTTTSDNGDWAEIYQTVPTMKTGVQTTFSLDYQEDWKCLICESLTTTHLTVN